MKKIFLILFSILIILLAVRFLVLGRQTNPISNQTGTLTPEPTIISQETGEVKLLKNISAKEDLLGMTASPDETRLYISSFDENKIYVVDTKKDEIIGEIQTSLGPYGVAYLKNTNQLAASAGSDQILLIDPETYQEKAVIKVGLKPLDLAKSLDEKYLFTANSMDDTVSVVEVATQKMIKTIGVGRSPERLTLSQDGKWLYVNNRASDDFSVISVDSLNLTSNIKINGNPTALIHSEKRNELYILDSWSNEALILDAQNYSLKNKISVGELPVDLWLSPSSERLYVLSFGKNALLIVNLKDKTIENQLIFSSGFLPETGLNRLYLLPQLQKLYISNTNFGKVVVLEAK